MLKADGNLKSIYNDGCYTHDFLDRLNSHDFKGVSDYSNEIFIYYYVRMMELHEILKLSDCSRVDFFTGMLDRAIFLRAKSVAGLNVSILSRFWLAFGSFVFFIPSVFLVGVLAFFLPFYLIIRKRVGGVLNDDVKVKSVFLIRSKAAYQKCRLIMEREHSSVAIVDDFAGLNESGISIYSVLNWKNILTVSFKSFYYSLSDIKPFLVDCRSMLGFVCGLALLPNYITRIAHKAVYESCLKEVIRLTPNATFYTGDKDDRFALLQTRVCNVAKRRLICLPHGLEYGFRFPGGLAGSTFYCFTPEAAKYINNLYCQDKFVYSDSIVDSMYGIDSDSKLGQKVDRICFFTEPRDPEVNYQIISELVGRGIQFYIKLHPLESSVEYKNRFPFIEQITDIDDAMCSRVCMARKSTVLLEASRKGSKSIALLINKKDRIYVEKIFPSLCTDDISKAYTFDEIQELILI